MTRELCINKFNLLLNDLDMCKSIENSIYNFSIHQSKIKGINPDIEDKYFKRIYVNKIITLYTNLDKNSYIKNNIFIDKIYEKDFDIKNIAFLTPQEINRNIGKNI